jgi:hypothetical protein
MRGQFLVSTMAAIAVFSLIPVRAAAQYGQASGAKTDDKAPAKPTPRMPDGHPNLTGVWGGPGGGDYTAAKPDGSKQLSLHSPTAKPKSEDPNNIQAFLFGDEQESRREKAPNQPPYKPELLPKVKSLVYHGNFGAGGPPQGKLSDPAFFCNNPGVPRLGPPMHIYQSSNMVVFLYAPLSGNTFKEIPIDGRAHDPYNLDTTMGDSVGHWDGDTLVIDSAQFSDETWLAEGGIHSSKLHVVERLTRDGVDTLRYQATVEDPEVLTKPWVTTPRTVHLNPKGNDGPIVESPKCEEREAVHMQGPEHK